MAKAVFIDGHSLVHRAFFALPDSWVTAEGLYTNAVYGFLTMLLRLREEEKPDYLAVVFDTGRPTFRHTEFGEYKAHRPGTPDRLRGQIPLLKETLEVLGIRSYEMEGYEADDVLATLARKSGEAGAETLIVTGDRDFLQLVDEKTRAVLTMKGISETVVFDPELVRQRYGVSPSGFADFRGLVGDPSDNLPGVPGVGPKTAARLLEEFGSLDAVLDGVDRVRPERLGDTLRQHAEQARLTRALARLKDDVPLTFALEDCRIRPYDSGQVAALFRRLEFRSLLKKLGLEERATTAPSPVEVTLVQTVDELEQAVTGLAGAESLDLAFALGAGHPIRANLRGLALTAPGRPVFYVPVGDGLLASGIPEDRAMEAIGGFLAQTCPRLRVADLKSFSVALGRRGIRIETPAFDPTVAAYLLDPGRFGYALDSLAREYLDEDVYLPGAGKRGEEPDLRQVLPLQVELVQRLSPVLERRLAEDGLDRLFREVEMPLSRVLAGMELAGVGLDRQGLEEMASELGRRIGQALSDIHRLAGRVFNPNSPRQLAEVLFEDLSLPPVKKTRKGAVSTDVEVLEELADRHQVVARILEHRQLVKLKGTYVDGLRSLLDPVTGRVHTSFNQTVTATGRLSSAEPNLQNIPIRLELGRRIRKVFVPYRRDHLLLAADYSQIELRVLAHLSGDPTLVEAFRQGEDIHARTAREVFGEVNPEFRARAKAVNFGLIYGMTDYGLSRDLGVPVSEAARYIEQYFQRYSRVQDFFTGIVEQARQFGYVSTILGRRRYLPELKSANRQTRGFAERAARNTPIQGSAADIIKLAMVRVQAELERKGLRARMILQVHDELLFEVPPDELEPVMVLAREEMTGAFVLAVPLVVDLKVGPNWYDVRKIEEA
ncbi:MAG: DNA polymerase I [bacterium]|nr:DNA polymerase I [bacterium]